MTLPPGNYRLVDLPGEDVFETDSGRWQYMSVHYASIPRVHSHHYYHLSCDSVEDDGRCLMCGAKVHTN